MRRRRRWFQRPVAYDAAEEAAPTEPDEIEAVIDESTVDQNPDREGGENGSDQDDIGSHQHADAPDAPTFENIETGVLQRDLATHEAALLEETDEGEVLDLGRVEGLSAAPSVLRNMVESTDISDLAESDTIKKPE